MSDGTWTKEQVKAEYQKKGYSIVAFTDHRHYGWHPELQDDSFLPIAGFEADMDEPYSIPGDWNRRKTYVVTESRSCKMKLANVGETIDEAVFPLTGNEGYIRVDCRDASGRHAYSNAYRFNVL